MRDIDSKCEVERGLGLALAGEARLIRILIGQIIDDLANS